jgi:hypothetical protein
VGESSASVQANAIWRKKKILTKTGMYWKLDDSLASSDTAERSLSTMEISMILVTPAAISV